MKRILVFLFISLLAFGCSPEEKTSNDTLADTVIKTLPKDKTDVPVLADSTKLIGTHLADTAMFTGSWVIFLRPDSARFDFYSKKLEAGIYETDADFGDAISMAIDSIVGNKDFKGIKGMVSTKRYITLLDCKGGPLTIDRDTVNYGIILTGTDRVIKAEQNVYGGAHYVKVIRKYFGIK
jgi:hypothetical protein